MSKLMLSYLFKTNLASFRSAILEDNTDKICRILDVEREYLNKGIDSQGNTALHLAIEFASPLTVHLLLEQGAQPDQANAVTLQTPLSLLASKMFDDYQSSRAKKAVEMAKILLRHGAFVDKPSPRNYQDENNREYPGKETPLLTAVRKKNFPMAKLLVENKANVNYSEHHSKIRAIHFAVNNGDEAMFDLLDNAGALISSSVSSGNESLLHWFCYNQENDQRSFLLKKLLEKGCDVHAENWNKRTPLFVAVKNDMVHTCRILLKAEARIDHVDEHGYKVTDLVEPSSECATLFHSGNKPPPFKPRSEGMRRPRRRVTTDLSRSNTSSPREMSTSTSASASPAPSPYVYPLRREDSDEMDTKYERLWDKLLQKRRDRRAARALAHSRSHSLDIESTPPV